MPKIEKAQRSRTKSARKIPRIFVFLTRPTAITQSGPLPDYLSASSPRYIAGYRVLRLLLNSTGVLHISMLMLPHYMVCVRNKYLTGAYRGKQIYPDLTGFIPPLV